MHRFAGLLLCALATPCFADIATEQENNNTESRANGPVGPANRVSGGFSARTDVDWYWFDLPAPGLIDISLSHASANDFDWALYPSSGAAVLTRATSANPETGSYSAATVGRYYLKLTSYRGSGSYQLDVSYGTGGGGGGARPAKPANLQNWLIGNAADAGKAPVGGPGLLLMGGNFEVDAAFTQRAFPIANGGDVVVLRTSGSDGYNDYLYNLVSGAQKPDSVETLLIDTRDKANSDFAEWVVRNAELVFMAGGDQSAYLNAWRGTRMAAAIRAAYDRGAVIGGISAGLAVQGEYIYDPDGVTAAISSEALANPYRGSMLFSPELVELPLAAGIITDSHFQNRDRMGRLMAFMARLRQDGTAPAITGVGVDEDTSLFIDRNRVGTLDGDGYAYVLQEQANTERTQIVSGQPLIYRNLRRTRLDAGNTFNFGSGVSNGSSVTLSVDGRNSAPFTPSNPY